MKPETQKRSNLIDVGRICGVFGVKGWVRVKSSTEPLDNIVNYSPWWLKTKHGVKAVEVSEYQQHSAGLIVSLKGIDDRDVAQTYNLSTICVERNQLKDLADGDYYWHELIGLSVVSEFNGRSYCLGVVSSLLETGANDVLVVKPSSDSIDDKERLLPYVLGDFVLDVEITAKVIKVAWDPEF